MGGGILRYACSPMLTYGRYAALRLASQALSFPALAAKSLRTLLRPLTVRKPCFCGSFGWKLFVVGIGDVLRYACSLDSSS